MSSDLVSGRNALNMNAYEHEVVGVNHCSSSTPPVPPAFDGREEPAVELEAAAVASSSESFRTAHIAHSIPPEDIRAAAR